MTSPTYAGLDSMFGLALALGACTLRDGDDEEGSLEVATDGDPHAVVS